MTPEQTSIQIVLREKLQHELQQEQVIARRRLKSTLDAITTRRLVMITLDRGQFLQNSYVPQDLGHIDLIERQDGWGDVVIGSPHVQSSGYSLAVVSPLWGAVCTRGCCSADTSEDRAPFRSTAPAPMISSYSHRGYRMRESFLFWVQAEFGREI